MTYDVLQKTPAKIVLRTTDKARRGRGVLFATSPVVVYLLTCMALFGIATRDLSLWERAKEVAAWGAVIAAALSTVAFLFGRRVRDTVEANRERIRIQHVPAAGKDRVVVIPYQEVSAFAVDAQVRSLGSDILWVAVLRDGQRIRIAEGEPHSDQIREVAREVAVMAQVPMEAPRFTRPN